MLNLKPIADENRQVQAPMKIVFDKRPFVLSMGPQRCATSWLDRYLRQRGDVCLPSEVKEVRYFDKNFDRGLDFYKRHFKPEDDHKCIMEVSTTCFDELEGPARVFDAFGHNVRLICPLRHPVSRSYSLYLHYKRYGQVEKNATLREACAAIPHILESSRYTEHLKRWFSFYPVEAIKFIFQEDLEMDQRAYIEDVCAYLRLPYLPLNDDTQSRYNSTATSKSRLLAASLQKGAEFLRRHEMYKIINAAKSLGLKKLIFGQDKPIYHSADMSDDDRAWLEEQLLDEVEVLEALIGPIPHW